MSDSLRDSDISKSLEQGKKYGDGATTVHTKTEALLTALRNAEESTYGPKVELVPVAPGVEVDDKRDIPETKIENIIYEKWGETPDTLISNYIAKLQGEKPLDGMIAAEFFETNKPPKGVEKVVYQFGRRGVYGEKNEFEETEIVRLEFRKTDLLPKKDGEDPNDKGGELVTIMMDGQQVEPPQLPEPKSGLEKNQFIDEKSGMLVTYYSVPVT